MSVINKMLRDLDKRQGAGSALRLGTASVPETAILTRPDPQPRTQWGGLAVLVVLAIVTGAVALWQWGGLDDLLAKAGVAGPAPVPLATAMVVPEAVLVIPAAVASAPVVVAPPRAASEPIVASAPAPAASATGMPTLRTEARLRDAPTATASASKPPAPDAREAAKHVPPVTMAPVAPTPPASAPLAQRQQMAAKDVITQAQTLWNTGSRDAAMELLQESLAIAERSGDSGVSFGAGPVALVRELTRLQLASGRPGAAWDLLSRLEVPLRNEADLWAVRGNAAQRLSRHQDSVHAYLMALQSRPGEQRWLLGAAVSLAALGQTTSAAEMAEKARAVGSVSSDVLGYLRQMGVPLTDR